MVTVNLEEMAEKLRISMPTLRKMMRRYDDFPVVANGSNGVPWQLDPAAVIAFVQAKRDEETANKAERDDLLSQISLPIDDLLPEAERVLSPAERHKLGLALKIEDDIKKQRGLLANKSEIKGPLVDLLIMLVQGVLAEPAKIGKKYNLPDGVVRSIRRDFEDMLRELHRGAAVILRPLEPPPEPEMEEEHESAE